MKSKIVIRLLAVIVVFYSCQQVFALKNDWQKEGLKGKVKSVKEIEYLAIDTLGKIQKGVIRQNVTKFFDNNGNLIQVDYYNSDQDTIATKFKYMFDDKGNRVELLGYVLDSILVERTKSKFDNKGNEIEWDEHNDGGGPAPKGFSKYDSKGNKIEDSVYNWGYIFEYRKVYRYDEKGNMIEEDYYDSNNKFYNTTTYKYEFDNRGNWIKRIAYNAKTKSPETITEREITYY